MDVAPPSDHARFYLGCRSIKHPMKRPGRGSRYVSGGADWTEHPYRATGARSCEQPASGRTSAPNIFGSVEAIGKSSVVLEMQHDRALGRGMLHRMPGRAAAKLLYCTAAL